MHSSLCPRFTAAQLRLVQIKVYLCTRIEYSSVSTDGWEVNSLGYYLYNLPEYGSRALIRNVSDNL
jgi:hypothetical protein